MGSSDKIRGFWMPRKRWDVVEVYYAWKENLNTYYFLKYFVLAFKINYSRISCYLFCILIVFNPTLL